MSILLDTNVAIFLQNREPSILRRLNEFSSAMAVSLLTVVELEGGVTGEPALRARRRRSLDVLIEELEVIDFDAAMVAHYRRIIEQRGFSRGRVLDRLIAATALFHDLTLVTTNGPDFQDIPGLKLTVWPRPSRQAPQ